MHSLNLLIGDDESIFCNRMAKAFGDFFSLKFANSPREVENILKRTTIDLMILDLDWKESGEEGAKEGLNFISKISSKYPEIPVIIASKYGRPSIIADSMAFGAKYFLYKEDFKLSAWLNKFHEVIKANRLQQKDKVLKEMVLEKSIGRKDSTNFISKSPVIEKIKEKLQKVSQFDDVNLLILGESGVGKEEAAKFFHSCSLRNKKPFVAVNLSAFPETLVESALFGYKKGTFTGANQDRKGLFEEANGGVLFLDEIGDINLSLQLLLLRFLQDKKIRPIGVNAEIQLDVQIVCATNKNLKTEIEEGNFRRDLYERLKAITIKIPPLRERKEDIIPLTEHFLKTKFNNIISPEVKSRILNYNWEGNVRELKNSLREMRLNAQILEKDKITIDCLPEDLTESKHQFQRIEIVQEGTLSLKETIAIQELGEIEKALIQTNGKKAEAAELLGLNSDQILRYKVTKKYLESFPYIISKFPRICQEYKINNPYPLK